MRQTHRLVLLHVQQGLEQFAGFDQSDFDGLAALQAKLTALDHKTAELEVRWLELSELLA